MLPPGGCAGDGDGGLGTPGAPCRLPRNPGAPAASPTQGSGVPGTQLSHLRAFVPAAPGPGTLSPQETPPGLPGSLPAVHPPRTGFCSAPGFPGSIVARDTAPPSGSGGLSSHPGVCGPPPSPHRERSAGERAPSELGPLPEPRGGGGRVSPIEPRTPSQGWGLGMEGPKDRAASGSPFLARGRPPGGPGHPQARTGSARPPI